MESRDLEPGLPSPKKLCLTDQDGDQFAVPLGRSRCSTPVPSTNQQQELETLGLSDASFESFIEDVEEEEAVLDLSQHGLDDQSFSEFLDDVENDSKGESDITVDYSDYKQENTDGAEVEGTVFPVEILENVFCRVPFTDLFLSVRLVCRHWNGIITRESPKCFIKWKVAYYKQRLLPEPPSLAHRCLFNTPSEYKGFKNVLEIASFIQEEFSHFNSNLKSTLMKHEQYPLVHLLADSASKSKSLSDLEELVVLVVSCHDVHQLLHLVDLLRTPVSGGYSEPCLTYMELSELFYCMATLLLVYLNKGRLPPRFQYYVFYTLDVMERNHRTNYREAEDQPDIAAQHQIAATASREKLTSEQLRVINHLFQPGQTIKVMALAGTGKTTTLFHLTQKYPHLKFLYCVYNQSVKQCAESVIFKQCNNVDSKTFHGLAFRVIGHQYKDKLGDLVPLYISYNLQYSFNIKFKLASLIKDTLNEFFSSSDEEISEEHIPLDQARKADISKDTILNEASSYWLRMQSLHKRDSKVKMTHDGYLKLYQLQQTKDLSECYDVILVDEAQDLTPAIIDILTSQNSKKIFVGDPNQQIYSFRGATNAFGHVQSTHTYHLTRSFRFGPEIAYVTAMALRYFKCQEGQFLVGNTKRGSIHSNTQTGQVAIISRLNSTLFDEMVHVVRNRPTASIAFAGISQMKDLDSKYGFTIYEDLLAFKNGAPGRSLRSNELKHYKSYSDLTASADRSESILDKALLGKIKVFRKYGEQIPGILKDVRKRTIFNLDVADFIFTTAHKSKGLEFDTVKVSDDFTPYFEVVLYNPYGEEVKRISVEEDERNLAYVAMSRAKRQLVLPESILEILKKTGESFVFPKKSEGGAVGSVCAHCGVMSSLSFHKLGNGEVNCSDISVWR